ncbi:MAG TPA: DUF4142 domain-containing protein [Lacunisphaera sp.]|jgi:putative membrane protein|nr:DUF4142 domain-containing protein [Lacunisphaera sp.]
MVAIPQSGDRSAMNIRPARSPFVTAKMSVTRLAIVIGFSVAALAGIPAVRAQTATDASSELRRGDQHFLRDLIERTEQNLAAAKVAQSDAGDPRVRRFAASLADRDQDLDRELTGFANAHHFVSGIPAASRWKWSDELRKRSGSEFDRKFLGRAIDAHEELLGALKDAADDAKDPALRAIAQSRVSQYKQMVEQAEELKGSL